MAENDVLLRKRRQFKEPPHVTSVYRFPWLDFKTMSSWNYTDFVLDKWLSHDEQGFTL